MGSIRVCDECDGAGAHGYESGPAVERCPRCRGAGVLFADATSAVQDFAAEVLGGGGAELQLSLGEGGLIRALAGACAALEGRITALEREVQRLRN